MSPFAIYSHARGASKWSGLPRDLSVRSKVCGKRSNSWRETDYRIVNGSGYSEVVDPLEAIDTFKPIAHACRTSMARIGLIIETEQVRRSV